MFIGHFAMALAARRAAPGASLGTLVVAAQLIDLVWPVLLLAGVERVVIDPGNTRVTPLDFTHYPFTHSLLMVVVWAVLLGALFMAVRRDRRAALVLVLLVLSHWLLDFITHRPDLPLYPGDSPRVGLGLWNSPVGTMVVEGGLFVLGVWLYAAGTRAENAIGRWGFVGFVALLIAIHAMNLVSPPPPSAEAIGYAGLGLWLFPLLAWWFDRHRQARNLPA